MCSGATLPRGEPMRSTDRRAAAPSSRPRSRRPTRGSRRQRRRRDVAGGARRHLRRFRQATILAVAITGFLLLLFAPEGEGAEATQTTQTEQGVPDTVSVIEDIPVVELQRQEPPEASEEAVRMAAEEAVGTIRELWVGLVSALPAIVIALVVLLLAWPLARLVRAAATRLLQGWERSRAFGTLLSISVWLFAVGVAVSVLAGDIRAMIGSLGLIGLALSWALQTPIESFTGWLLNSFRGYYRVGDRIAVGEVFGDVYRIDTLATTVWEYGGTDRPGGGFAMAEQPTGRLITFPNNEVLAGTLVNYTRDFPFVWDELHVAVGNRSDLEHASRVLHGIAVEVVGEQMIEPAARYERILQRARLESEVSREPQVFVSLDESWTTLTVRYLVPVRERRRWKSTLSLRVMKDFNRPEHEDRIRSVYPRQQVQLIDPDERPVAVPLKN